MMPIIFYMWWILGTNILPNFPEIITTAFTVVLIYSVPSSIVVEQTNSVSLKIYLNYSRNLVLSELRTFSSIQIALEYETCLG
jgi:hypothetical protein